MLKRVIRAVLILGALLTVAWALGLFTSHAEICAKNPDTGQKECATYNIALVALWHVGEFLNYYGVAVSALATVAIAAFTYTLYRVTGRQARLTLAGIRLAQNEFVSTFRPKMAIRSIMIANIGPGKPISIDFGIFNVGESTAHIRRRNATILIHRGTLPPRPPYNASKTIPEKVQVVCGGSIRETASTNSLATSEQVTSLASYQADLYLIGYVHFVDDADTPRECAFCRKWDPEKNRFRRLDPVDSDYEYEDYG